MRKRRKTIRRFERERELGLLAHARCYALIAAAFFLALPASAADRPNILFILADDLGWSDLGCYGSEIFETPRLDQLASEGTRFTQAYAAAPICSASRAAILTGKTPARLGFEFVVKPEPGYQPVDAPLRAPPYTLDLPLEEVTIAEVLRDARYRTAFFGKWHLNQHFNRYLGWSPTHGPKAQGFEVAEEDFGSHPYSYWTNRDERTFLDLPEGEFVKDGLTEKAVEFLKQDHDRPFFLMVSHFYVHDPIHTRLKWLYDHYLGKLPADHPRREVMANYGAMVTALDHYVGQLLDALDEAGLTESTYVVFTSDNGGHPEYAGNAPLRGSKWNLYEGGIRVPYIIRRPDRTEPGVVSDQVTLNTAVGPISFVVSNTRAPSEIEWDPAIPPGGRMLIWHFPYYHPEKRFPDAPAKIGIDDGHTSQTRPQSAIRYNEWKLIHFYEDDRDELYNLEADPYEQDDLSSSEVEKADWLRLELDRYLKKVNARLPQSE